MTATDTTRRPADLPRPPWPDGVLPTDEEFLDYLLGLRREHQVWLVAAVRSAADEGHRCFQQNHDGLHEDLLAMTRALARQQREISRYHAAWLSARRRARLLRAVWDRRAP